MKSIAFSMYFGRDFEWIGNFDPEVRPAISGLPQTACLDIAGVSSAINVDFSLKHSFFNAWNFGATANSLRTSLMIVVDVSRFVACAFSLPLHIAGIE